MAYTIGYFVGSLAEASINRTLSKALINVAPSELEFHEIEIRDLPLYSYDYDESFPPEGTTFKQAIESSDGILFVSPEYNRSIPGALKNAIDWGSRPWGTNSFARKPTGIIGASPGGIGTAVMQSSMRGFLSFLDAPQLNSPEAYITYKPEVFGDDGEIHDESTKKFLTHYMAEYAAFVQRVLAASAPGHIGDPEASQRAEASGPAFVPSRTLENAPEWRISAGTRVFDGRLSPLTVASVGDRATIQP